MKRFYMFGLVALIASASAAQAHDNAYPMGSKEQRIHNQEEYWRGKTGSNSSVQKSSDYDFAVTPQQRLAERNSKYFSGKVRNSGADVVNNLDYDFAGTPAQRTAKRSYDYFKK